MEELLNKMNHKLSFILSALNGTKEELTKEQLDDFEKENEILIEAVEKEQEIAFIENSNFSDEIDDFSINTLIFKIVNHTLIHNTDYYDEKESEDFLTIMENSIIDNNDVETLIKNKKDIMKKLEDEYSNEDYYKILISTIEELLLDEKFKL